ncbi:hypothetical protein, partial [Fischerella thermalis]|uniref:hypothetical protein n=1 Tax=Fischerella thermalis TaxID=372787 RepID=UPI003B3BACD1
GNKTTSDKGNRGSSRTAILEEDVIFTLLRLWYKFYLMILFKIFFYFLLLPYYVYILSSVSRLIKSPEDISFRAR